jgi:hypothetical protein
LNWLKCKPRSEKIKTYDFTNLFGNEPVRETLEIFVECVRTTDANFSNSKDQKIWGYLMDERSIPNFLLHIFPRERGIPLIAILTATSVMETFMVSDSSIGQIICSTSEFLAMGTPPVAPLSNITLAYLEKKQIPEWKLLNGMRRLIDDIAIDERAISEVTLRSVYPNYLTLNSSHDDHFLDVSFKYVGKEQVFATWPYIKPYPTLPLNYLSFHPRSVIGAVPTNELRRLMMICSDPEMRIDWINFWYHKFHLAGYPDHALRRSLNAMKKGFHCKKIRPAPTTDTIYHVEEFRGYRSEAQENLKVCEKLDFRTCYTVAPTLRELCIKSCIREGHEPTTTTGDRFFESLSHFTKGRVVQKQ